jgi:hypothetical protein
MGAEALVAMCKARGVGHIGMEAKQATRLSTQDKYE